MLNNTGTPLDDLDLRLAKLLSRGARQTNRALAGRAGVSEIIVANWIRRLSERGVARLVGVLGRRLAGQGLTVVLLIRTAESRAGAVAAELAI